MTTHTDPLFPDTLTLAELVDRGWEHHPAHPQAVVDALAVRAASLPADGDAAGAITLAEHVCLAHLHAPERLASFLHALPAHAAAAEATAAALQRARWALAAATGEVEPPIDPSARWRALQNVWGLWAVRGRAADAQAMLAQELPQALAHPDAAARKALAACCNNLASDLKEGERGHADRDGLMIAAAEAALQLWRSAGTWLHHERAEYRLSRCLAAAGQGDAALRHALACLATIEANGHEPDAPFERFFGHEAAAWAQAARGDAAGRTAAREAMLRIRAAIADESLQPWCDQALAALDAQHG